MGLLKRCNKVYVQLQIAIKCLIYDMIENSRERVLPVEPKMKIPPRNEMLSQQREILRFSDAEKKHVF
jgi:hypothetical protein